MINLVLVVSAGLTIGKKGKNWTTRKAFLEICPGGGWIYFLSRGSQNPLGPENPRNHKSHWSKGGWAPIAPLNTHLTPSLDTKTATFDKTIKFLKYIFIFSYKRLVFWKKIIFKWNPWTMNILLLFKLKLITSIFSIFQENGWGLDFLCAN